MDAIERLGRWCAPAGMNFVGGEPLMRTDLEQLIRHAVDWGFDTSFNTNAWLVTPSRAESIADSNVGLVYISLDGFSTETVDISRGKEGSFEKLQAGCKIVAGEWGEGGDCDSFARTKST